MGAYNKSDGRLRVLVVTSQLEGKGRHKPECPKHEGLALISEMDSSFSSNVDNGHEPAPHDQIWWQQDVHRYLLEGSLFFSLCVHGETTQLFELWFFVNNGNKIPFLSTSQNCFGI